jgi:hypothetical protein
MEIFDSLLELVIVVVWELFLSNFSESRKEAVELNLNGYSVTGNE